MFKLASSYKFLMSTSISRCWECWFLLGTLLDHSLESILNVLTYIILIAWIVQIYRFLFQTFFIFTSVSFYPDFLFRIRNASFPNIDLLINMYYYRLFRLQDSTYLNQINNIWLTHKCKAWRSQSLIKLSLNPGIIIFAK